MAPIKRGTNRYAIFRSAVAFAQRVLQQPSVTNSTTIPTIATAVSLTINPVSLLRDGQTERGVINGVTGSLTRSGATYSFLASTPPLMAVTVNPGDYVFLAMPIGDPFVIGTAGLTKNKSWALAIADQADKIAFGVRNGITYAAKFRLGRAVDLTSKKGRWNFAYIDQAHKLGIGARYGIVQAAKFISTVSISAPFISGLSYKINPRLKGRAFGGISNGQSLSVGSFTTPLEVYPYYPNNALKLVDTGAGDFATLSTVKLAPITEPLRIYSFSISEFPLNCMGEGGYNVLGTELTRLLGPDLKIALDAVGVGGASMNQIRFGGSYNSFASSILQYTNMRELFKKKGLQFEILFNLLIHGQADALSATYLAELNQYYTDTQNQHRAITGQITSIPLIIDQNSAGPNTSASPSLSSIAQWQAQKQFGKIIMATPGYQYYGFDTNHLSAGATKRKYIKFAQVIKQVCFDHKQWRCTDIVSASVSGSNIIVNLYIPFGSVEFDPNITQPANINWGSGLVANPWVNAKGFECFDSGGAAVSLISATITGQSQITLAFTGGTPATLRYALAKPYNGTPLLANPDVNVRGAVRDQDPYEGFDKQEILCVCTNGSTAVYSTNLFGKRAPYDRVMGIGFSKNAIIASYPAGNQVNISEPWKGQTGYELLTFVHPQNNYLAQFSVSLPYAE
jgi:hypothetical protein